MNQCGSQPQVPPWALMCFREDVSIVTILLFYLICALRISTPQNEFLKWDLGNRAIICAYANHVMKI